MRVELYAAGASTGKGPTLNGGAGIVLRYLAETPQRRELSFGLATSDAFLSDIQAVRLALAAVGPAFRNDAVLFVDNKEIADLLSDVLSALPDQYVKHVDDLKRWYSYYTKIEVEVVCLEDEGFVVGNNQHFNRAKELAVQAMKVQKSSDSKTFAEK